MTENKNKPNKTNKEKAVSVIEEKIKRYKEKPEEEMNSYILGRLDAYEHALNLIEDIKEQN